MTPAEADELITAAVMSDEGRQDPYPTYAALRESSPRWRSEAGSWVIAGYRDGLEVLKHPKLGRPEGDMEVPRTFGQVERDPSTRVATMLMLNPPDHTRIRSLVSRAFTPRRVEELRSTMTAMVDPIIGDLVAAGGDVMDRLAVPFPVAVISAMLGVSPDGNERIRPLVRSITSLIDPAADEDTTQAGLEAALELAVYFSELAELRRAEPDSMLLSALIEVEAAGDRLSIEELISNTILLYAAGFETTSNLIGNGLRLLLEFPDQMQLLRDRPELMASAVLEMLRYDSPVQLNLRVALEPVELFGETHQRGAAFVVLQGSGNLDETVYDDAATFDVTRFVDRDTPQPLSFGWGAHHCLGAHLARAEGEIVFSTLLALTERIELAGDTPPRYRPSFTLRGLESLPAVLA